MDLQAKINRAIHMVTRINQGGKVFIPVTDSFTIKYIFINCNWRIITVEYDESTESVLMWAKQ